MQPDIIVIDNELRLKNYNCYDDVLFALDWYQSRDTLMLVDGYVEPYTVERLHKMYSYLNNHGELYMIEILIDAQFVPIGDVAFWQYDMPIVIGDKKYRGRGIGKKVVACLVARAKALNYDKIFVSEIYDYNLGSINCFKSNGFDAVKVTDNGHQYRLLL